MSAAVEKRSNAEAVEGTGSLVQAIQTHSDDRTPTCWMAVQILAGLGPRDLSLPRRHTAEHTYHTRSSDSRRSARTPRPLHRISAPHRPLCVGVRSASLQQQYSSNTAAVPGVVRTSSSCACTQDGASWCRHNTCAAASLDMGHVPRRKPRCTLSAAALLRIIDGGCSLGPRRGRLRASVHLDPSIL